MTGIFKGNDIRGTYNKDLTIEISKKIGHVFDINYKKKFLIIGRDNRLSSKSLKEAFLTGVKSKVIDLGIVPTPLFYYALDHIKNSKGAMVTASHLPKQFNGFKLQVSSVPLTYSTGINSIQKQVSKTKKVEKTKKQILKKDLKNKYISYLVSKIKIKSKLRLALDAGNGVGALVLLPALRKLGIKVKSLYCNSDPTYPNHVADPIIDNTLTDLRKLVLKKHLDFGIALDGDADRMKIVGPKGNIVQSEVLACLILKHLNPRGQKVIYSAICSDIVKDVCKTLGSKPILEKVGHSFIKKRALKQKAILSVEYTGHIGFRQNNYNDDAIFAALKAAEIISKDKDFWQKEKALSGIYFLSHEIRINASDFKKQLLISKLKSKFRNKKQLKLDGLKIYFDKNTWAIARPSLTENKISLRFQAKNKRDLSKVTKIVLKEVKKYA